MSAVDAYHEANALFVDGKYADALASYTRAIDGDPQNANFYSKRAVTHMRLKNYIDAVADATKSVKISPDVSGFLLKGEALFLQDEFDEAAVAFKKALDLAPDSIQVRRWIRKCQAEKAGAVSLPTSLSTVGHVQSTAAPSKAAQPMPAPAVADPSRIRHEWYQTQTHVVISVLAKGVPADAVSVSFERAAVDVTIRLPGSSSEYQLSLSLFAPIAASECDHKVTETKVEIRLKKADALKWDTLEGTGEGGIKPFQGQGAPPPIEAASRPAYPTSRPKKTNWDEVEHEITREEAEEKPEGDEALNKLFREIYARSDEDTRRAMNKSFQTSGGTVLSTNWGEVAEKDYEKERVAPTGQEWKKWG